MPLNIFDGNNFARVEFEVDPGGLPLRRLYSKAYFDSNPCIFVFDGKNSKALRLAQYPQYKSKRNPPPDNFHIMLGFYKELLQHTNKVQIEVPGYEADDVIATLVRKHPDLDIVIHSTDRDFCALETDRVKVPNANLKGVDREHVRLYKTLVGDPGDAIGGIRLFGDTAWGLLDVKHKAYWMEILEAKDLQMADHDKLGLTRELHRHWLAQNHKLIQTFWDIVGFYTVPDATISQHTIVGTPNYPLAESKLLELLQ